jgi:hypothetical protein
MTRKDYELIAGAIRTSLELYPTDVDAQKGIYALKDILERRLADENERFNRETFRKACNPVE